MLQITSALALRSFKNTYWNSSATLLVLKAWSDRTATLLEGLGGYAVSRRARSIYVNYKKGREWVFANKAGMDIPFLFRLSAGIRWDPHFRRLSEKPPIRS